MKKSTFNFPTIIRLPATLIIALCLFWSSFHTAIADAEDAKPDQTSAECITELGYGSINWTTGLITSVGKTSNSEKKKPDESEEDFIHRSARDSAQSHLADIMKSIGLPERFRQMKETSLDSLPAIPDNIRRILEVVRESAESADAEEKAISKKAVETTLKTTIFGNFLQAALPSEIKEIPSIELFEAEHQEEQDSEETNTKATPWFTGGSMTHSIQSRERYSGLVIDARGIGFKPVICPVIVNEQGEEIYSPEFISRKYAVERGVCSYICSPDPKAISRRAGNNPITIKGLRKDNEHNYQIVISMTDADRIQKMPERHLFMKACRVLILVSPP